MKCFLVPLLLLATVVLPTSKAAVPTTGNGGYGLSFDRLRRDVVAWRYNTPEPQGMSVEFWMKIHDMYQDAISLFSFSSFDGTNIPVHNTPNEFACSINPSELQVRRVTKNIACSVSSNPGCAMFTTNQQYWVHYALTWDKVAGVTKVYRNGEVVWIKSKTSWFVKEYVPNAVIVIGQEPDAFVGDFDENQSLDGIFDEFRLWGGVRTAAEIKANYNVSITSPQPNLRVSYNFNAGTGDATDLSGQGHTGLVGRLPLVRNVLTYNTRRTMGPPTSPVYVTSSAPITGGGLVVRSLHSSEMTAGSAVIDLAAADSDGDALTVTLTSTPATGSIVPIAGGTSLAPGSPVVDAARSQSKRVTFTFTPGTLPSSGVSFTYSVADATSGAIAATVKVLPYVPPAATPISFTGAEDTMMIIVLGATSTTGDLLVPTVTSLPPRGRLFQASFLPGIPPQYSAIQTDPALLTEITTVGTTFTNTRGFCLYLPPSNANGGKTASTVPFTSFNYTLGDGETTSGEAVVTIHVTPVNDPPVGTPVAVVVPTDTPTVIQLNQTDVDTNFAPHPLYRFSTMPRFGTLMQVEAGRNTTAVSTLERAPTVVAWAAKAENASSQYSQCPDCSVPLQCDLTRCTLTGWHMSAVEGPSITTVYGDSKNAWASLAGDNPEGEWIEMSFDTPVYLKKLEMYVNYAPGAITRVSATDNYRGYDTQWRLLWSGDPVPGLPEVYRVFTPPVCQLALRVAALRIFFDSAAIPDWQELDAVRITGSMELTKGVVADPAGRVTYVPRPGVHSAAAGGVLETLRFAVSDCEDESPTHAPVTVSVTAPTTPSPADSVWRSRTVDIPVDTMHPLPLLVSDVLAEHGRLTGGAAAPRSDVSVTLAYVRATTGATTTTVHSGASLAAVQAGGGTAVTPGTSLASTHDAVANDTLYISLPAAEGPVTLALWVTVRGVTFREAVHLNPQCSGRLYKLAPPAGTPVDAGSVIGSCIPCETLPQQQIAAMPRTQRLVYEDICVLSCDWSKAEVSYNLSSCLPHGGRDVTFDWQRVPKACQSVSVPARLTVPCEYVPTSSFPLVIAGAALAGVLGTCFVVWVAVKVSQKDYAIMHSSPLVMCLTVIGALLGLAVLPMYIGAPTPMTCQLRVILTAIAYCVMYAPLSVLVFRRYAQAKHKLVLVTELRLLARELLPVGILLIVLLVWLLLGPPRVVDTPVSLPVVSGFTLSLRLPTCRVIDSHSLAAVYYLVQGLWLILGIVRAVTSRKTKNRVVALDYSGACAYTVAVFTVLPIILSLAGLPSHLTDVVHIWALILQAAALPAFLWYSRTYAKAPTKKKKGNKNRVRVGSVDNGSAEKSRRSTTGGTSFQTTMGEGNSLQSILEQPIAAECLFNFLAANLMDEIAAFFRQYRQWKALWTAPFGPGCALDSPQKESERKGMATIIIDRFIKQGAELQLNLPGQSRDAILQLHNNGVCERTMFRPAMDAVIKLTQQNALPKFGSSTQAMIAERLYDWYSEFYELDQTMKFAVKLEVEAYFKRHSGGDAPEPLVSPCAWEAKRGPAPGSAAFSPGQAGSPIR